MPTFALALLHAPNRSVPQVLSDPNRRRQYDLSGGDEDTKHADFEPMNMEEIGNVGRVLGALVGKLGVPIPTSIAQSSLSEAAELCQNRGLTENNPKLLPIKFGVEYKVMSVHRVRACLLLGFVRCALSLLSG